MKLVTTIKEMREQVRRWKAANLTIGFVPTMGFLHEGHASLIRQAAEECDKVVVSIFVNPMQFGPTEDLASYPRDIDHDKGVCLENGAQLIFFPEVSELYPDGFSSFVNMDGLTNGLCGTSRPEHFRGVCTVVTKLFNIVQPDRAFFGQKDAQQLAIIRRMTIDLSFPIEIIGCPIVREPDGLALSSRNKYLNEEERTAAHCLSAGLNIGKSLFENRERDTHAIKTAVLARISQEALARVDYVEVVDPDSMQPIEKIDNAALCAVAVFIGKTRLIDNIILED
ncbi:pantoate--beta-alanine ligase [Ornithinibacillus sp. 16A2E]|uniref:Pantothenate synthetase n=2 Tax=Ornithinibacillus xuwenensis TaxID=3144668 RepID=A0ABU9XKD9_9BACI